METTKQLAILSYSLEQQGSEITAQIIKGIVLQITNEENEYKSRIIELERVNEQLEFQLRQKLLS